MPMKMTRLAATLVAHAFVVPAVHADGKLSCVTITAGPISLIPDADCQITQYQKRFPGEAFFGAAGIPDTCFTLYEKAVGDIIITETPLRKLAIAVDAVSGLTFNSYPPILPDPYGLPDPESDPGPTNQPRVSPFTSAAKIEIEYDGEEILRLWTRDSGTSFQDPEVFDTPQWVAETLVITGSESHFDDYGDDDEDHDTAITGRLEVVGPIAPQPYPPEAESRLTGQLCGKQLKQRLLRLRH